MKGEIVYQWNCYLDKFPVERKDIYFREEYVKLYEAGNERAVCFIYIKGEKIFLHPFLKRMFYHADREYFDFETPYGYGGPITNIQDNDFFKEGLISFFDWCSNNHCIAGFVRFHPLLDNSKYYKLIGDVIDDRLTVAMDLSLSEHDLWMSELSSTNRRNINKAKKNGLGFTVDKDFLYSDTFVSLYNNTMQKVKADDFYYFQYDYFLSLKNDIPNSFLGLVWHEEKIVAAAIYMYCGKYGHYHLGGSDINSLEYRPNNFLQFEAAKVLKSYGVEKFHLGGGTTSDEHDPLFIFKSKFSSIRCIFSIGKTIFNQQIYNELCEQWELKNPSKKEKYKHFLLKYKY